VRLRQLMHGPNYGSHTRTWLLLEKLLMTTRQPQKAQIGYALVARPMAACFRAVGLVDAINPTINYHHRISKVPMSSAESTGSYLPLPYPWQQSLWQHFIGQYEQSRLPHALLLTGQKGIGKGHYANVIADFLLCASPMSNLACGQCRSCQLNLVGNHPDKSLITPEDGAKLIKVDQIRHLSSRISNTAQQGGRKLIILGPVEQLNSNAANALLKNLEEPSGDTFFILYSHVFSGVIATIRSRCQLLSLPTPDKRIVIKWLEDLGFGRDIKVTNDSAKTPGNNNTLSGVLDLAGQAPLLAKSLLDNSDTTERLKSFYDGLLSLQQAQQISSNHVDINIAKLWLDIELNEIVEWWLQLLQKLVTQPYKERLCPSNSPYGFIESMTQLQKQCDHLNMQWLHKFMDKLFLLKKQLLKGANPNKQLLLEELLMDWCAIISSGSKN
jgi:DNA polymerase-3 subunit delta'